jgi:hypothetical protein
LAASPPFIFQLPTTSVLRMRLRDPKTGRFYRAAAAAVKSASPGNRGQGRDVRAVARA